MTWLALALAGAASTTATAQPVAHALVTARIVRGVEVSARSPLLAERRPQRTLIERQPDGRSARLIVIDFE